MNSAVYEEINRPTFSSFRGVRDAGNEERVVAAGEADGALQVGVELQVARQAHTCNAGREDNGSEITI